MLRLWCRSIVTETRLCFWGYKGIWPWPASSGGNLNSTGWFYDINSDSTPSGIFPATNPGAWLHAVRVKSSITVISHPTPNVCFVLFFQGWVFFLMCPVNTSIMINEILILITDHLSLSRFLSCSHDIFQTSSCIHFSCYIILGELTWQSVAGVNFIQCLQVLFWTINQTEHGSYSLWLTV